MQAVGTVGLGPKGPFPDAPLTGILERRWLHYAFLSRDSRLGLVANLSWLGAESSPQADAAQRMGILLLHEQGLGWQASQFNCAAPAEPWSSFRQPLEFGAARPLLLAAQAGEPFADLLLTRTSRPCTSQSVTFAGDQHFRWQSESGVIASGNLGLRGEVFTGVDALGYHERVRGRWSWPALGGWVFGFVNDQRGEPGGPPPAAVVFTLIQPTDPPSAPTASVMLWQEGRLRRHFPRRNIDVAVAGLLERDRVAQVPDLSKVFGVAPADPIPSRLVITARLGSDRLLLDFECESAARIVIPSESGLAPFSVHEVVGSCTVKAEVAGHALAFEAGAIVEFAGGARPD